MKELDPYRDEYGHDFRAFVEQMDADEELLRQLRREQRRGWNDVSPLRADEPQRVHG